MNMREHLWGLYNFVSDERFHPAIKFYRITPDVPLSWRRLTSCDCVNVPVPLTILILCMYVHMYAHV